MKSEEVRPKTNNKTQTRFLETEQAPLVPNFNIAKKVLAEAISDIRVDHQLPPVLPINLSFKDLFVWGKKKAEKNNSDGKMKSYSKVILDGISGSFKEGTSTAILGPSGSGKTTLLDFLCSMMHKSKNLSVQGKLLVNGHHLSSIRELRHRLGYVMQHDQIFEYFSPMELFTQSALLAGIPEPKTKVKEVIELLGLEKCKDTQIGEEMNRRLSGGELKRTSIGLELITDPTIIFLDEPTTGLDSKSALDVAKILKMLSKNGRTIITTLHQPSKEILERFDRVMCLCEGKIIYDGPPGGISSYCSSVGYPVPSDASPTDHLMKILSDDDIKIKALEENLEMTNKDVRKEFKKRLAKFEKRYHQDQLAGANTSIKLKKYSKEELDRLKTLPAGYKRSTSKAALVLFNRCHIYSLRKVTVFYAKAIKTTIQALLLVTIFSTIVSYKQDTLANIQSKSGMIFSIMSHAALGGVFSSVSGFLPTLKPFLRENRKKMYSPVLFYFISSVYSLPLQLILAIYYQLIFWFLIDIKQGWASFFKYLLTLFTAYSAGVGFGDVLTLIARDRSKVNQLLITTVTPFLLTSGMVVVVSTLPKPLFWLSYINLFRFAYQACFYIEFDDQVAEDYLRFCRVRAPGCYSSDCTIAKPGLPACSPFIIADFVEKDFWVNIYYLLLQVAVFRVFSVWLFYRWSRDIPIPYKTFPDDDDSLRGELKGVMIEGSVKNDDLSNKNNKIPAPKLKKKCKSVRFSAKINNFL